MTRLIGAAARPLELEELIELTLGEPPRWYGRESCFASEEQRRAAWQAHRGELGGMSGIPGHRCWGWWRYEAKAERPEDRKDEILAVAAYGDLEPRELEALERQSLEADARISNGHAVVADLETAAFYGKVCEAVGR